MKLSWERQRIHLREPFQISRAWLAEKETMLVRLDHDGLTGYGEAVATTYYRQSIGDIEATLRALAADLAELDDPLDLQSCLDDLVARYPAHSFTLAALDSALHDWIGKRLGQPLCRLLGLDPRRIRPTAYTIGIDTPDRIERQVGEIVRRGFTTVKLKLGLPSLDVERAIVAAARRAAPAATLWLDPNAAWSPDDAIDRIAALAPFRLALVEQPIAPGQLAELARLSTESHVPIIADEDAITPDDIPKLAGCVAGVNIKLVKCGGLRQALRMIHAAHACGLTVMLGCMTTSSLGIAPAAHLAPLAEFLDLDGHLDLVDDPWEGIGGTDGQIRLTERDGLGLQHRTAASASASVSVAPRA